MAVGDGKKRTGELSPRPSKKIDTGTLVKIKPSTKIKQLDWARTAGGTRALPVHVFSPIRGASTVNLSGPSAAVNVLRIGVTQDPDSQNLVLPCTPSKPSADRTASENSVLPRTPSKPSTRRTVSDLDFLPRTPTAGIRSGRTTAVHVDAAINLSAPVTFGKDVRFAFNFLTPGEY